MNSYQVYQLELKRASYLNYCYIIVDQMTRLAAVIDPAWELETIVLFLRDINAILSAILLTHSHFDHVDLVQPLLSIYNPRVIMSSKEIAYYHFKCENLTPVEDGDSIKLGQTEFKCLITPGHTAGSTCFLLPDSLFTGDTVFIEGCGICDTIGGNAEEMFNSIQKIKNTVSPEVFIYPAHSYGKEPGYPLSYLLKENIYFQIDKLKYFVDFRMRK